MFKYKVIFFFTILAYNMLPSLNTLLENNTCVYNLTINGANPRYLLKPTSTSQYYPNMSCNWEIDIDYKNNLYMLYIDAKLVLHNEDSLSIFVCNTSTILYDTQKSTEHLFSLYTREEKICILFNSYNQGTNESRYYWYIYFTLLESPNLTQVIKRFLTLTRPT